MEHFLRSTSIIDWNNPAVRAMAFSLADGASRNVVAERCFNWVRDEVTHSFDVAPTTATCVTCSASDTLRERTGICYAKTHLLAALLRANSIESGFGYQRVALDNEHTAFCLHGFNYVMLDEYGWYAVDPRGNREGISTKFDPPNAHLAFGVDKPGEKTYSKIFPNPLPCTVDSLNESSTVAALRDRLPDWRS